MNQIIIAAISERHILEFTYDGQLRVVEPHAYGVNFEGDESLRAFQTNMREPDWRMFLLAKIQTLSATPRIFSGPRKDYYRNETAMDQIHTQL